MSSRAQSSNESSFERYVSEGNKFDTARVFKAPGNRHQPEIYQKKFNKFYYNIYEIFFINLVHAVIGGAPVGYYYGLQ